VNERIVHLAFSIGQQADQSLRNETQASILGVSARGVFLRTANDTVLFLSDEPWRGPLTINLVLPEAFDQGLEVGQSVRVAYPGLILPTFSVIIPITIEIWRPNPVRFKTSEFSNAIQGAEQLSAMLLEEASNSPFLEVLKIAEDGKAAISDKKKRMQSWLSVSDEGKTESDIQALRRFIGMGTGLTPAGDDLICGYLLARFALQGEPEQEIQPFIADAKAHTTALSAALIACTAQGSADERLTNALRFIAEGGADPAQVKQELLDYGNSSGIETLTGMVAAIYLKPAV